MTITTNIIIQSTALSGIEFKEAIDLGLVCAAFDQQVNLIFVDAGINNLIKNQSSQILKDKSQVDILKGLEFYDIDNIWLENETFDKNQLSLSELIDSVQLKAGEEINAANLAADNVVVL